MERLEDLSESEPQRVEIRKKAEVTKLLRDEAKRVIGVEYTQDGQTHQAHGVVVLATGLSSSPYLFLPPGLTKGGGKVVTRRTFRKMVY